VRRRGFELVPDFSGTAHSYIGCTLAAANVDRRANAVHACMTRTTQPYISQRITPTQTHTGHEVTCRADRGLLAI
jgi:hypothetical protein